MSDKVAYVAGNTSGRDHLTGYTLLRSEIEQYLGAQAVIDADELWPVDVTLLQAMAISWRVKKWRLTGTCDITAETTLDESTVNAIGSAVIDADVVMQSAPDANAATRESEIVSFAQGAPFNALANFGTNSINGEAFSTWSTQEVPADPVTGVRNTGDGQTQFGMATSATLFNPSNQLFSPRFFGTDKIIGNTPIGAEVLFAVALPQRNPVTVLSGTGTGNMFAPGTLTVAPGITSSFVVPMQLIWRRTGQSVDTVFSGTGELELTLEAVEFWPFSNSDGLPIYDTSNGSQLRSPFS